MRKTHFNIATTYGQKQVKIIGRFKHNERLWVVHYAGYTQIIICSDYLTGRYLLDCDSYSFEEAKRLVREKLNKNRDFDFSGFKEINKL